MELNDYSQRFARALFTAFPQWRRFELTNPTEIKAHFSGNAEGCFIVRIPSPVSVASPPCGNWLLIDTCDGEITITYDYFHEHFYCFTDNSEYEDIQHAIKFLQAFTSFTAPFDKLIIRTWEGSYDQTQSFVR